MPTELTKEWPDGTYGKRVGSEIVGQDAESLAADVDTAGVFQRQDALDANTAALVADSDSAVKAALDAQFVTVDSVVEGVVDVTDEAVETLVETPTSKTLTAMRERFGPAITARYGRLDGRRLMARFGGRTAAFAGVTTNVNTGQFPIVPLAETQYQSAFYRDGNKIVIPDHAPSGADYRVSWHIRFSGGDAGTRRCYLRVNGSDVTRSSFQGNDLYFGDSITMRLEPGDDLDLMVQSTTDSATVPAGNENDVWLQVERMDRPRVRPMLIGRCGGATIPGTPLDMLGAWTPANSWSAIEGAGYLSGIDFSAVSAADIGTHLIPRDLSSELWSDMLDEVANGERDDTFIAMGENLAIYGPATVYARPWWEMSIRGQQPDAEKFIAAWNHAVPLMRQGFENEASAGQTLYVAFCPALDGNAETWWPGGDNVDVITSDFYPMVYAHGSTPTAKLNSTFNQQFLGRLAHLGEKYGKPIGVSEWALVGVNTGDNDMGEWYGRGDWPDMVDQFFDWAENAGVIYANYFNLSSGAVGQTMNDCPNSLVRYQERTNLLSPSA